MEQHSSFLECCLPFDCRFHYSPVSLQLFFYLAVPTTQQKGYCKTISFRRKKLAPNRMVGAFSILADLGASTSLEQKMESGKFLHNPRCIRRYAVRFARQKEKDLEPCIKVLSLTWSGRRDSDSRHPPWQGGTLPLSYYRIAH